MKSEFDQLCDLYQATNKENPKPTDVEALRALLTKPELLRDISTYAERNVYRIMDGPTWRDSTREVVQAQITDMKNELGYYRGSQLEKLLIDAVMLTWLRWQECESQYTVVNQDGMTLPKAMFWERRLSAAQGRYLRACETLARVRKLLAPILQVNIAQDGVQQVNVAGDVVKGE